MQADGTPLTHLLRLAAQGERKALDQVFAALYPDLHRIAHSRLRAQGGAGQLQTTALVHESFLRLVATSELDLVDRRHFFTYAAKTMRNIIIDSARESLAQRRGGGDVVPLDTAMASQMPISEGGATLMAVNDALSALESLDPELAQVVEMRYFAGYSEAEIAELMCSSERTVRRRWDKARAFLLASMQE